MNEEYLYDIGATVWTLDPETLLVASWKVAQVTISLTAERVVTYILHNKDTSAVFNETNIYATINLALAALSEELG